MLRRTLHLYRLLVANISKGGYKGFFKTSSYVNTSLFVGIYYACNLEMDTYIDNGYVYRSCTINAQS